MPKIFVSVQKGGRHWLKVKAAGGALYWHGVVAWAFCNPRNLSWATFCKRDKQGFKKYVGGHLSDSEVDNGIRNLSVMTALQNKEMYTLP